jgi:sortase A
MIRALGAALLALAALVGGHGLWIPAKAALAQLLLADAWQRARAGERAPRPWGWADTWPVARIEAPRLGVARIVLAGAGGPTLAFAPGLLDGSARPGEPGNAIVAGHRDTSFRFLAELAIGDLLIAELADGRTTRFRVAATRVVDAADPWPFAEEAPATLTLVTCWPFDAIAPGGRLRYAVRAVAEGDAAVQAAATPRRNAVSLASTSSLFLASASRMVCRKLASGRMRVAACSTPSATTFLIRGWPSSVAMAVKGTPIARQPIARSGTRSTTVES